MGRSRRPSRSFGGVRSEATQAQPLQQVLFRDVTASSDATPGPPCGVHGARECAHKFRDEIFMFVVERERRKKDGGGDREEGERERGRRGEEVEEEGGMGGGERQLAFLSLSKPPDGFVDSNQLIITLVSPSLTTPSQSPSNRDEDTPTSSHHPAALAIRLSTTCTTTTFPSGSPCLDYLPPTRLSPSLVRLVYDQSLQRGLSPRL